MLLSPFYNPALPPELFFSKESLVYIREHLGPAIGPFLAAFAACVVLCPGAILLARPLGLMARPDRQRDIHRKPTARIGGLAMVAAFAAAVLWFVPLAQDILGIVAILAFTALVFVLDDRFGVPALVKFAIQLAVALWFILKVGYQIDFITMPGHGVVGLGLLALPLTLIWIVGMQNTVNLLDGVDGLAAGVVAIVAITLMIAATTKGQVNVVMMCAALIGACCGFLLFNFHPARIFMGDSGSQFLGLALAILSIVGVAKVAVAFAFVIPLAALAVPIADTAAAIIRRRRGGVSIAHADTQHIHHQLLDFGLNQVETCLVFYGATGILGAFGLMLFGHKRAIAVAVVFLMVVLSTVLETHLQRSRWRLRVPGLAHLLGVTASR